MINLPIKFEVPIFTSYGNMKDVENGVVRGHPRSLKITPFH